EAGDNRVMLEMYSQLSDRHRFTLFTIRHRLLERCEEIIAEHEALTRHLRSGDAAAFADTLRGHIAEHASPSTPARDTGGFLDLLSSHVAQTRHLLSGDAAAFADTLRCHIAEHASPSTPARDTGGFLEL